MRKHLLATAAGALLAASAGGAPVAQGATPMGLAEFQDVLATFADVTGSPELVARLDDLDQEEWLALYDAFANKEIFASVVADLASRGRLGGGESTRLGIQAAPGTVGTLSAPIATAFTPAYPEGNLYDTFVDTLPELGLLFDPDGDGTENDRCDDDGEADARIALGIAEAAAIVADTACNTIVVILGEGTNAPFCVAAGVLHELALAADIIVQQCGYQTALVDSAEIEAAYENTVQAISALNTLHTQLGTHDTNISSQLTTHDADISNQLTTHDTDIKEQVETHDTDIKAILNRIDGKVDTALVYLLDAIRLLNTPQGQRSTQVAACGGAPCNWPAP